MPLQNFVPKNDPLADIHWAADQIAAVSVPPGWEIRTDFDEVMDFYLRSRRTGHAFYIKPPERRGKPWRVVTGKHAKVGTFQSLGKSVKGALKYSKTHASEDYEEAVSPLSTDDFFERFTFNI